jgi:hypothetical protein
VKVDLIYWGGCSNTLKKPFKKKRSNILKKMLNGGFVLVKHINKRILF